MITEDLSVGFSYSCVFIFMGVLITGVGLKVLVLLPLLFAYLFVYLSLFFGSST